MAHTLIGIPAVGNHTMAPIAPSWIVVGFRGDRISRSCSAVPFTVATRIAAEWRKPEQRAIYRDVVEVIPVRWRRA